MGYSVDMINRVTTRITIVSECPNYSVDLVILAVDANAAPLPCFKAPSNRPSTASLSALFPSEPSARRFVYLQYLMQLVNCREWCKLEHVIHSAFPKRNTTMAFRSKGGSAALKREHLPGAPKLTRQGNGKRSKPSHGRKLLRGQGKG